MTTPPPVVAEISHLVVTYGSGTRQHTAVDDVSFTVPAGRTVALVGESGAGKSSIGAAITGLATPAGGQVVVCGADHTSPATSTAERRRRAASVQLVPQDPFTTIDPRHTVKAVLQEALRVHRSPRGTELDQACEKLLVDVGLQGRHLQARSAQLSGGQLQRVAIARALAARPTLLVLDEAVSALDVSVQAQVLNLLRQLQRDTGVAYLFITHDLGVVRQVADDVIVLRDGRVVEHGPTDVVLGSPSAEYTRLLLASTPQPGWSPVRRDQFAGQVP